MVKIIIELLYSISIDSDRCRLYPRPALFAAPCWLSQEETDRGNISGFPSETSRFAPTSNSRAQRRSTLLARRRSCYSSPSLNLVLTHSHLPKGIRVELGGAAACEHHPHTTTKPPPRVNRPTESHRQSSGAIPLGCVRPYSQRKDPSPLTPQIHVSEGEETRSHKLEDL